MTRAIVCALVGCVVLSAIGGFGAPLLCRDSSDDKCPENWRTAANGALAAAASLGTLLARINGSDGPR